MYEDILPGGALDKSIPFSPVEPLDCALLSHGVTPFATSLFELLPPPVRSPRSSASPSRGAEVLPVHLVEKKRSLTRKAPELRAVEKKRRKAQEPVNVTRVSTAIQQNINLLLNSPKVIFLRRAPDNMNKRGIWQVEKFGCKLPRVIGLRYLGEVGRVLTFTSRYGG